MRKKNGNQVVLCESDAVIRKKFKMGLAVQEGFSKMSVFDMAHADSIHVGTTGNLRSFDKYCVMKTKI